MALGGKREGAGRKKGSKASHTLDAAAGKARMVARIHARVDDLVDWLFKKAHQITEDGREIIDVMAIKELNDRGFGKAAQAIDVTSKGEQISSASPQAIALSKEYEDRLKKTL